MNLTAISLGFGFLRPVEAMIHFTHTETPKVLSALLNESITLKTSHTGKCFEQKRVLMTLTELS